MTGPEHWSEAEQILSGESCEYGCPHSGCPHEMRLIARAQVHATLALAAATALPGEHPGDLQREIWAFGPGGNADPDEPTTREIEPEPPGWYDVPDPEEGQ
jgi:hypothetical protein